MAPPLLDVLADRLLGLPGRRVGYAIEAVRIPLRDGVELAADLYRPATDPVGTVLVRSPYGRSLAHALTIARPFAGRGYQVLFVSSRGTFGSGGEFDPMRTEAADGQDVVAWLRGQPWFTGTFATLGGSYLGHTQWALLADQPPELAAAVIVVGPHDFSRHFWGTGAFNLDFLGWSDMIVRQEQDRGRLARIRDQVTTGRRLAPVLDALPLVDAARAHFAGRAPWYGEAVVRPDLTDPYWAPMQHGVALERATAPVLLITGWYDLFLGQTMRQYRRLHERGIEVGLTVGPWTHLDFSARAARVVAGESLAWLDEHLAGRGGKRRPNPVRVFVTGAREWREAPAWPPAGSVHALYPHPGGGLATTAPTGGVSTFTYDPAQPTPTVGGPLIAGGGRVDDSALAGRPDVLAFTGAPLDADLEVLGAPRVELAHTTDNPHADLFVRLSDVDERGRSHNVTEAYRRLDPDRPAGQPVELTLLDTAHRFRAGHRIRLLVAGGSHPQFARNLGTDENPGTGSRLVPAGHTLQHGASRLLLPTAEA